jgi:hypothetical protein
MVTHGGAQGAVVVLVSGDPIMSREKLTPDELDQLEW